jgi:tRNA(Ile)-lysidine synthase
MITEKVKKTLKSYDLLAKGDQVVVGVSGGPDSLALLYLLYAFKKEIRLKLYVAHLDHMLRKGSARDVEFVRNICARLKLPFYSTRINVKAFADKGSLEEIARNCRLGFLFKVAKDVGAKRIALGHNLDDQAETVLMRILRGAGLYGLSGILPKRNIAGFTVIRPLIEVKRKDIEAYLKKKKLKPRRDISNSRDIYFRNKIRNRLLPLLEKGYNKNIKEVLANMAETIAFDYDYLKQVAWRKQKEGSPRISLEKLQKLHPSMRRLILRSAFAGIKGDTRRLTFSHIREIEDLLLNRPQNSIVDLPGRVSVIKKKSLIFYRR